MRRRDFIAATDKENLLKLAEGYRTSSNELNVSNAPKMSVVGTKRLLKVGQSMSALPG
jgi:hypothetical protein